MNLLAGSLEQADAIFPDFVASLDDILSNAETTPELKENTMSLALLVVTSINQGSVNSYFLRRDLFSTVIKVRFDALHLHSMYMLMDEAPQACIRSQHRTFGCRELSHA